MTPNQRRAAARAKRARLSLEELAIGAEDSLMRTVVLQKRLVYDFDGPVIACGGPVTGYLGVDGGYSFVAVCGHDVSWRYGRKVHVCEAGRLEVYRG